MISRYGIQKQEDNLADKLDKQIIIDKHEDEEEDFSNAESILKFINKNSKYGRMVREIEHFQETVSYDVYKITGSED